MRATTTILTAMLVLAAVPAASEIGRPGEETYRCTVDVGGGHTPAGAPNLAIDTRASPIQPPDRVAAGGCQLADPILADGVVLDLDPAEDCTIYVDPDPSTPGDGHPLAEGEQVRDGSALHAYCDAGTTEAHNAVTVDHGDTHA